MKYHTTASTIIISVAIVLFFAFLAFFATIYLDFNSPGEAILSAMLEQAENNSDFSFSFDSIERQMSRKIVIIGLEARYKGEVVATADYLSLDMNPFQLLASLIFRSGRFEIEIGHPVVALEPSAFSSGSDGDFDLYELNRALQNLESHDLSGSIFSKYSYSLNVVDMDIRLGSYIAFAGAGFNLRINKGLVFDSYNFAVSDFESTLDVFEVAGNNFSFSGRKGEEGYAMALTIETLKLDDENLKGEAKDVALMISFPSFASLDIRTLPFMVSFESVRLGVGGLEFSLGQSAGQVKEGRLELQLSSADFAYSPFSLFFPRLDFVLSYENSFSSQLSSLGDFYLSLSPQTNFTGTDFEINLPSLPESDIRLTLGSLYSPLATDAFSLVYLDDFTLIAGRAGEDNYTLEGGFAVGSRSPISLFDGFTASFSYFVDLSASSGLEMASLELNEATLDGKNEPFEAVLDYYNDVLEARIKYSDSALFSISYDKNLSLYASLDTFPLEPLSSLFEFYMPVLCAYIGEDTSLSGSLSFFSESNCIDASLLTKNIAFSGNTFDTAFGLGAKFERGDNDLLIDNLFVSAFGLEVAFDGVLDLDTLFPQGQVRLFRVSNDSVYLSLEFQQTGEAEYYLIASGPSSDIFNFTGTVNWERDELVYAEGAVQVLSVIYPFDFMLRRDDRDLDLVIPGLILTAEYEKGLDLLLSLDNFNLPSAADSYPMILNGQFSFLLDLEAQIIEAEIPSIKLSDISFIENRPTLSLSLLYKNQDLYIEDILLTDGGVSFDLSGRAEYDSQVGKFALTLGNAEERINSGFTLEDDGLSGILEISDLDLARIGFDNSALDLILALWFSEGDYSVSGSMSLSPLGSVAREFSLIADLLINSNSFELQNFSYKTEFMELSSPSVSLSAKEGVFSGDIFFSVDKVNRDAVRPIRSSLSFSLDIGSGDKLSSLLRGLNAKLEQSLSGALTLNYLDMDNSFLSVKDKRSEFFVSSDKISFAGDLLDGFYEFNGGNLDLKLDLGEIGGLRAQGFFNLENFDLSVSDIYYDLSMINILVPTPIVTFSKGSVAYGEAKFFGPLSDFHMFAQAYVEEAEVDVFHLDKQYIRVGDLQASMVDNHAISSRTPVLLIDKESGEVQQGFATLEVQLSPSNILDYYDVFLEVEGDNRAHVRIPIVRRNIQLSGDVVGDFTVHGDTSKTNLSGDLYVEDALFSIGMDELPAWLYHESKIFVRNDYNVVLGPLCSFVMPLGANPIITASFAENTTFSFLNDSQTNEIDFTGDLIFRSGEIYYFEKNFYITSGNLGFDKNDQDFLDPRITLNARLRDFDSKGEKLDIFLILNNSSLSNLNPYFDSSPKRDVTEIMEILGAAILPTSAYGSNLTSVASLVSSGVEMLGRTGYLGGTLSSSPGISNVIRSSLGLDIFSLRTSLFRNFLIDTIFTDNLSSYSPVARYLNDTAIYFGKYITQNVFLQGMIHLEASKRSVSPFIANDLDIDLEISLEWQTPLGQITFATAPSAFTLYNLFDGFSLSYSNRIQF